MSPFGKRELNKAQTKLAILEAMHDLIIHTNFRELKAKDIAARADVTEMTFFNYFKSKDDLLIYFMQVWTLDVMAMQQQTPLKGETAIRRIFAFTAKQISDNPRLMLNLISYQASQSDCPKLMPLEAAECYLRHPEIKELHMQIYPDLSGIFLDHLNEIHPDIDYHMTQMQLFSCFYGDALISHLYQYDLDTFYTASLNLILKEIR